MFSSSVYKQPGVRTSHTPNNRSLDASHIRWCYDYRPECPQKTLRSHHQALLWQLPGQGTFIQCTFREHSVHIQGTFREHSGNIQGTFREHSGNIQCTWLRGTGFPQLPSAHLSCYGNLLENFHFFWITSEKKLEFEKKLTSGAQFGFPSEFWSPDQNGKIPKVAQVRPVLKCLDCWNYQKWPDNHRSSMKLRQVRHMCDIR